MYNGATMAGLSPIEETPGREGEAKRVEHVLMNLLAERDRLAAKCAEGEEALKAAEEKLKEGEATNAALVRQLQAVLPEIEVSGRKENQFPFLLGLNEFMFVSVWYAKGGAVLFCVLYIHCRHCMLGMLGTVPISPVVISPLLSRFVCQHMH